METKGAVNICSYKNCEKVFSKPSLLKKHFRKHTGECPYVCSEVGCEKSYTRAAHLKRHKDTSHGNSHTHTSATYKCTIESCETVLSSQDALTKHTKQVHQKRARYKCLKVDCDKIFVKKPHMREHLDKDHGWPTFFRCEEAGCDKHFKCRSHLVAHSKMHKGYFCDVEACDFSCEKWSQLRKHRAHEHRKDYKCGECGRRFFRPRHLKDHLATHNDNRDIYPCPRDDCSRKYLCLKNLTAHIRSSHDGQKYQCTYEGCIKTLSTKQKLELHQKMHEPNRQPVKYPDRKGKRRKKISAVITGHNENISENSSHKTQRAGDHEPDNNVAAGTRDCFIPDNNVNMSDSECTQVTVGSVSSRLAELTADDQLILADEELSKVKSHSQNNVTRNSTFEVEIVAADEEQIEKPNDESMIDPNYIEVQIETQSSHALLPLQFSNGKLCETEREDQLSLSTTGVVCATRASIQQDDDQTRSTENVGLSIVGESRAQKNLTDVDDATHSSETVIDNPVLSIPDSNAAQTESSTRVNVVKRGELTSAFNSLCDSHVDCDLLSLNTTTTDDSHMLNPKPSSVKPSSKVCNYDKRIKDMKVNVTAAKFSDAEKLLNAAELSKGNLLFKSSVSKDKGFSTNIESIIDTVVNCEQS